MLYIIEVMINLQKLYSIFFADNHGDYCFPSLIAHKKQQDRRLTFTKAGLILV